MRSLFIAALGVLFLSGCGFLARDIGYAGANPGSMECSGKAVITAQGSTTLSAGLGGSGMNGGTITFDCGSGAYFKQGSPATDQAIQAPAKSP